MAKDFADISRLTEAAEMNASSKENAAVTKLVKIWEAKNTQRAARAAGLSTLAISLAACGTDNDVADAVNYQNDLLDPDGDGFENSIDAFQLDPNEWLDTDGDGLGDNADPIQSFTLTVGQDYVDQDNDLVVGILGESLDVTHQNLSTFNIGDIIEGDGNTKLLLNVHVFTSQNAAVAMSGVNFIEFNTVYDTAPTAILNGSTYGDDVSIVAASGKSGLVGITRLSTNGEFTIFTADEFTGTLLVGDLDFDVSDIYDVETITNIDVFLPSYDAKNYFSDAISTDLYSAPGVKANLYIDAVEDSASSVNLFETEVEVNAGSGRAPVNGNGDQVGAHVFHHVNATEDLVTAEEITIATVDINVAKGAHG